MRCTLIIYFYSQVSSRELFGLLLQQTMHLKLFHDLILTIAGTTVANKRWFLPHVLGKVKEVVFCVKKCIMISRGILKGSYAIQEAVKIDILQSNRFRKSAYIGQAVIPQTLQKGFIPGYSRSWLTSSQDLSHLFFHGLGNLERSQLTGSWQMLWTWYSG